MKAGKLFRDCPDCPEMIIIPAGIFDMGTNDAYENERPVHRVTIKQAFAIGKIEVTQELWCVVMDSNPSNPENYNYGDNFPVNNVSWDDVQEFIYRLNLMTDKQYRLPTEAEWEYACRAAAEKQPYSGSDSLARSAVFGSIGDTGGRFYPRCWQTNAYGLCDMESNVWEWVEDCYHENYDGAPVDGSAWQGDGRLRVLRSGSWGISPWSVGGGGRLGCEPAIRDMGFGFRLARVLP